MPRITRSKTVKLSIMEQCPTMRMGAITLSVSAVVLMATGCTSDTVETGLFKTVEQCEKHYINRDNREMAVKCSDALAQAEAQHTKVAPKYTTTAECEEQHGKGQCSAPSAEQTSSSSVLGSVVMPLMLGYMVGNSFNGTTRGYA